MILEKLWPLFTSHTSLASGHRVYQEMKSGPSGADLGRGCRECTPCSFLIQLVFCEKNKIFVVYWGWSKTWDKFDVVDMLICILCSSHYVIAKSKAFFVFAFKICLRHQLVMPFLSGVPQLRKILDLPLHM